MLYMYIYMPFTSSPQPNCPIPLYFFSISVGTSNISPYIQPCYFCTAFLLELLLLQMNKHK